MDDKRVEKNKENVMKLRDFLLEVCSNYATYQNDESIISALNSQGNLSKYENEKFGIKPSSLNTLKRTSAKLFSNGFEEIDKLRLIALEKLSNSEDNSIGRNTKEYFKKKKKKLDSELEQQKQINILAIHELMNDIQLLKNIKNLKEVNLIHHLCDKHIARLQSYALNYAEFSTLKKDSLFNVIQGGKNE